MIYEKICLHVYNSRAWPCAVRLYAYPRFRAYSRAGKA
nr:MAG TPA: hypothetical protein [Caudoviricetes sp.]